MVMHRSNSESVIIIIAVCKKKGYNTDAESDIIQTGLSTFLDNKLLIGKIVRYTVKPLQSNTLRGLKQRRIRGLLG